MVVSTAGDLTHHLYRLLGDDNLPTVRYDRNTVVSGSG